MRFYHVSGNRHDTTFDWLFLAARYNDIVGYKLCMCMMNVLDWVLSLDGAESRSGERHDFCRRGSDCFLGTPTRTYDLLPRPRAGCSSLLLHRIPRIITLSRASLLVCLTSSQSVLNKLQRALIGPMRAPYHLKAPAFPISSYQQAPPLPSAD